jgi:AcrR family transcriptional regulator
MTRRTQQDRSSSTRSALETAARTLFAERGYADVSTDEIVRAAGVTRGALYHHYADKKGLFEAVFRQLEREITNDVAAATADTEDVVGGLLLAFGAFLDLCMRPEVRRIGLTDAPAVLGWARWREIESEHGLGLVVDGLNQAVDAGILKPVPVMTLARLMLSSMIEAALVIANADDPAAARAECEQSIGLWLASLIA